MVILVVFSLAASIGVGFPIHGALPGSVTVYEVPVELTLEPSDAAYASFYSPGTLGARWWWSDDDDDCSGGLDYMLTRVVGPPRAPEAAQPLPPGCTD